MNRPAHYAIIDKAWARPYIQSLPRSERGDRLLSRTAVPSLRLIPNMRPTVIKDHFHYITKFHADQSSVSYVGQPFKPKTTPVSFQI